MPNRRENIHDYYRKLGKAMLLEKAAASAITFPFKGDEIAYAAVTRTDLNGYSTWARDKTAGQRAAQLDAFFSSVVPAIETAGGVFFRDEGDCIVALFSGYFDRAATFASIEKYCMTASQREYGSANLTAKTCVCCGDVAIFQKQHEKTTGDWSAEGEPFVRAARLEQAVQSGKQITFFEDD